MTLADLADLDLQVENHGSIVLLRPLTDAAKRWIDESINPEGWQWFGHALAVEPRYVGAILEGMQADGLIVQ